MMGLKKAYYLYQAIGFVVLVPVTTYEVFKMHLPRIALLVCIPAYCVLAIGCYQIFKNIKSK
jgi:hypothetical protein